jgi:hypothetical protein
VVAALLAATACTSLPTPPPEDPRHELVTVPFFPQTAYHCGPAALATTLVSSGVDVTPEQLAPLIYVPARRGSFQVELVAATRRLGRIPYVLEPTVDALLAEVAAGNPVLVLQDVGRFGIRRWHYAVVVGHFKDRNLLVLRSGGERRRLESLPTFTASWRAGNNWALVTVAPDRPPATASAKEYARSLADGEKLLPPAVLDAAWTAAADRWPGDATVLFGAANAAYAGGRLQAADSYYQSLLALAPDHAAARNNRANLLLDRGCLAAASAEVRAALASLDVSGSAMTLPGGLQPAAGSAAATATGSEWPAGAAIRNAIIDTAQRAAALTADGTARDADGCPAAASY